MKRILIVMTVIALAALSIAALAQREKEAETLFHRGVHFEEVRGELKEAIAVYEKIIKEFPDVRPVVAKAILHIGICYEKMGQKEAQKSYRRVIVEFSDQAEAAAEAKARLIALEPASAAAKEPGGIVVRRVHQGLSAFWGSASPDGRYLSDTDLISGNLLVRNLSTGGERFLTENSGPWNEFALPSVFSSDGKQLAYAWFNKDKRYEIRTVGLDGTGLRTVIGEMKVNEFGSVGWSPDDQNILAAVWRDDKTYEIVQASVKTGSLKVLKTLDGLLKPKITRLSPDGRYIVYAHLPARGSQNLDIFLFSVAGGDEIPLVQHEANDTVLGWTPDGKGVFFASDRTGSTDSWFIPVTDGRPQGSPRLVKRDIGEVTPLGFTRNGSFYYGVQATQSDVFTVSLDIEGGKILSAPAPVSKRFVGSNDSPAWSPDGKFLAYILRQTPYEKSFLCIHSMETGEERDLAPQMYMRSPLWSPDGRTILVFGRKAEHGEGLFFLDPQTGGITPFLLLKEGLSVRHAAWSPDGKAIFFRRTSWITNDDWFMKRDIETGQETELLHNHPMNEFAVSSDGQRIVFRSYDLPDTTLKTMLSSGRDVRDLVRVKDPEFIPGFSGQAWTPDGRFVLYFVGRLDQGVLKTELWRVDVVTGERKSFGLAMNRMRNIALHPDGKRIAFESGMPKMETWVMENFLPRD